MLTPTSLVITNPYPLNLVENNFKVNKIISTLFDSMEKLINFLTEKERDDIEKIFKTKNAEEFLVSIEYLIDQILTKDFHVNLNQLSGCIDLINLNFPEINPKNLKDFNSKIENLVISFMEQEFNKPYRKKSFDFALEKYKEKFELLINSNISTSRNKQELNIKKIKFLCEINELAIKEKKFSKILKEILRLINKSSQRELNYESAFKHVIDGKQCYALDELNPDLLKKLPFLLIQKTHYVSLKSLDSNNISTLKNLKKECSWKQDILILKRLITILKLNKCINSSLEIKYKPKKFHEFYFPLLYNNLKHITTFVGDSEKLNEIFKLNYKFEKHLRNSRRNTKKIQNLLSCYVSCEKDILVSNKDLKPNFNKKQLIRNTITIRNKFHSNIDDYIVKNLSNYQMFLHRSPQERLKNILCSFKKPNEQEILISLSYVVKREMLGINVLKQFFQEIHKQKTINPYKLQTICLAFRPNFIDCKKYVFENNEVRANTIMTHLILNILEKISKKTINDLKLHHISDNFVDDIHDIISFDPSYHEHQKLLYKHIIEKIDPCKLRACDDSFLLSDIQFNYSPLPIEPLNEQLSINNYIFNKKPNPDIFLEEILPIKSKRAEIPQKKINDEPKKNKKNRNIFLNVEPERTKKPTNSFFNTVRQAVHITSEGTSHLIPQIVLSYNQNKSLGYVASEAHQINKKLPGSRPKWKSIHPRVTRWNKAQLPLGANFPHHQTNQEDQIFYHTMPQIAHHFIKDLGFKEKCLRHLTEDSVQKSVHYTAIAYLSKVEKFNNTYVTYGKTMMGSYSIEIRDDVLFHDAFSPQAINLNMTKSAKGSTDSEKFENDQFSVDIYSKNHKIRRVYIIDKYRMKSLEMFETNKF